MRDAPMLSPAPSLYTETYAGAAHLPPARASTKPWPRSDVMPADAYALCRNTYAMPPPRPAVPACACTLLRGAAEAHAGKVQHTHCSKAQAFDLRLFKSTPCRAIRTLLACTATMLFQPAWRCSVA